MAFRLDTQMFLSRGPWGGISLAAPLTIGNQPMLVAQSGP
jgi:hypothetical protein